MRCFACVLTVLLPLYAAAQAQPTINTDGIVRADTSQPGILALGIVFSVWGHNYGPKDGCKGPAAEVCGVQVLLDGAPIEVQFTSDVLIHARMPEGSGPAVSKLVVVSGGVRSEPVEVRRLPEIAVISLDGVARVDGPVWIHVEHSYVSYPALQLAGDFACDSFEVRKDGKLLVPIAPPRGGMMVYGGPGCPGYVNQGKTAPVRADRLPLHLQYNFAEPGVYEVRLSHYGFFGRRQDDIRTQSAWTPIQVLRAGPRAPIGAHPQEPDELLTNFLPSLLAVRDDETLAVLMEYLYHPSQRVRGWALSALPYWPDAVVQPRLMETLRANGPTDVVVQGMKGNVAELAEISLPFLFSSDAVLFQGAIRAANVAVPATSGIDDALRARVERDLTTAATSNLGHADAQMKNDLIAVLGQIHTARVHDLLWNLVDHHTGTEQALIAIAWQKDPKDLPRLADYLNALPADDQTGREAANAVYAMHNSFGDAAAPWLRDVLAKTQSPVVRQRCVEELKGMK